jgi:uncharacterized membrane protein
MMTQTTDSRAGLTSPRNVGLLLVAIGLLVNPWTLGLLFAPDGSLDGEARVRMVVLVEVFCILSGVALASARLRTWLAFVTGHVVIATALIAVISLAGVGTWWGISAYRGAHHHTMDMSQMAPPTTEQEQWAADFVERCWESARRHGWFKFDAAKADGFELQWSDTEHYLKRDFVFDDKILDPDRPEFLMYRDTPHGKLLMGFMFFTRKLEERGPTPAGSLASWHFHPWGPRGYCAERGLLPMSRPDGKGQCAQGEHVTRSAEMLHVWFVDHPLGPFADAMLFPDNASVIDPTLVHPMVVHFAIALLFIAVTLDIAGKIAARPSLHQAAFINLALASVFAVATIAAGMLAEVRLLISHETHQVLDTHKLLGFSALGGVLLLLGWRLATRGRFPARGGLAYLAMGVLVAALTGGAGYYGSELVYVKGVAVQAIDRHALERHERAVANQGLDNQRVAPAPQTHVHGQ